MKILKDRMCVICGKKFDVYLGEKNEIPVQFFFSKELGKSLDVEQEYWECENCSGFMLERFKEWMKVNWGERCPDYCEECALCKAWKCFDYLFEHEIEEREDASQ